MPAKSAKAKVKNSRPTRRAGLFLLILLSGLILSALSASAATNSVTGLGPLHLTLDGAHEPKDAVAPYRTSQISGEEALQRASGYICGFMLKQARPKDVELFVAMAKLEPTSPDKLPLRVVVPGFIISDLRTAFQMGFLILVPFILIDLVVSTVLMSMGMMMLPPATISMPLKILLFVLVDGWALIVRSLVMSFGS